MMSEEKELFKAGTDTEGFSFDLGNKETGWVVADKSSFNLESGVLNLNDAKTTYRDEKGNEITKEQFNELRIKKLEETILNLEVTVSSLTGSVEDIQIENNSLSDAINLKVNSNAVISAINTSQEGERIRDDKIFVGNKTIIENDLVHSIHMNGREIAKEVYSEIDRIQKRKRRI